MADHSSEQTSTAAERLRANVERAVEEIERLRQENAALEGRIEKLRQRPEAGPGATVLTFDEPPEVLRTHVEQLIESIDQRLIEADLPNTGTNGAHANNGS